MTLLLIIALLLIGGPVIGWLLLAGGLVIGTVAALIGFVAEFAIPIGVVLLVVYLTKKRGR